jgi:hypothetical protein
MSSQSIVVHDNSHKALGVVSEGTDELHSDIHQSVTPPTVDLIDQEAFNFKQFLNKDLPVLQRPQ